MSGSSLIRSLLEEGRTFDFFQAVRLLERFGEGEKVGMDAFPHQEAVRFEPWLSLAFPTSPIHRVMEPDPNDNADSSFRMLVKFMGLYGTQGILPRHYTELLIERARRDDHALKDFLDIFNHRLISLFFRAHEKYRYASTYSVTGDDSTTAVVKSILGEQHADTERAADLLPRRHLLRYAGLFSQRPRSVKSLEAITSDYFGGVKMNVAQFVGRWVPLSVADRGRLSDAGGRNRLGRTLVIGARIWDRKGKFRLRIGPLEMNEYLNFMPGGSHFGPLCALVREFVGDHMAFEIQPVLKGTEIPPLELRSERELPVRLGRTTWLLSRPCTTDSEDARFDPAMAGEGRIP